MFVLALEGAEAVLGLKKLVRGLSPLVLSLVFLLLLVFELLGVSLVVFFDLAPFVSVVSAFCFEFMRSLAERNEFLLAKREVGVGSGLSWASVSKSDSS